MDSPINRREALKILGAAAIGIGFRDFPPGGDPAEKRLPSFSIGRTIYSLRYYELPSLSSKELGFYNRDTVIQILEERDGEPVPGSNSIWLRTKDGWLQSGLVQPVQDIINTPVDKVPDGGMLCVVTVPFSQAWDFNHGWRRFYRCYYGSAYWVTRKFTGLNSSLWYEIYDERYRDYYAVQAQDLRPVTVDEVAKISPDVQGKRIEIDLSRQRLIAYEFDKPVFSTRTATGIFEGTTPIGEFRIERKQPTRHMASNLEGNEFDLPGVPWVCYISWTGVSFHGTYWHNNYGHPQSHGCINLTPEAAKWVYRWSDPFVPIEEDYVEIKNGTRVVIYES